MVVRAQRFLVLRMSPGKHTPVDSSSCLAMGGMAGDAQGLSLGKRMDPSHRLLAGLQEHICKGEIVVREGQLSSWRGVMEGIREVLREGKNK